MDSFVEKISSYNLFNYLFPGIIFCLFADNFFSYSLIQESIILGVFLYYFVGLVISRIGSLLLEPLLKYIGFVEFSEYNDFIEASKADPKIDTLSEVNNMYRTIIALLLSLVFIAGYEAILFKWPILANYSTYIIIILLLVMFLFSYKKQTSYIRKRVLNNTK